MTQAKVYPNEWDLSQEKAMQSDGYINNSVVSVTNQGFEIVRLEWGKYFVIRGNPELFVKHFGTSQEDAYVVIPDLLKFYVNKIEFIDMREEDNDMLCF